MTNRGKLVHSSDQRIEAGVECAAAISGVSPAPSNGVAEPAQSSELTRRQILRQRAAVLRTKPAAPQEPSEQTEIVEFAIGGDRYGLVAALVQEVQPFKEISPLPGLAAHVLGIFAVRGQVIPVIDLRGLFDLPPPAVALPGPCVLILGSGESIVGVLADELIGVRRIKTSEIRLTQFAVAGKRSELVSGVTADCTAILRGERLVSVIGATRRPFKSD